MGRRQYGLKLYDALFLLLLRRHPFIGSFRDHLVDHRPRRFTRLNAYRLQTNSREHPGYTSNILRTTFGKSVVHMFFYWVRPSKRAVACGDAHCFHGMRDRLSRIMAC
jgi:hypothetical protein